MGKGSQKDKSSKILVFVTENKVGLPFIALPNPKSDFSDKI